MGFQIGPQGCLQTACKSLWGRQQLEAELCPQIMQERLDQQRKEAAEDPDYGKTFKGQPTKEEKKAKRKQIIATIGETWKQERNKNLGWHVIA